MSNAAQNWSPAVSLISLDALQGERSHQPEDFGRILLQMSLSTCLYVNDMDMGPIPRQGNPSADKKAKFCSSSDNDKHE